MTPRSFLSHRLQAPCKLELVNTMMDGLAVGRTLRHRSLVATAAHTNPVDDITLLGLVAQPARLVGLRGPGRSVQRRELEVLPAVDPQQEAHQVRPTASSSTAPGCTCRHPSWLT